MIQTAEHLGAVGQDHSEVPDDEECAPSISAYQLWTQAVQGGGWADDALLAGMPPMESYYQRREAAIDAQCERSEALRLYQWPVQAVRTHDAWTPAERIGTAVLLLVIGWWLGWAVPLTAVIGGMR